MPYTIQNKLFFTATLLLIIGIIGLTWFIFKPPILDKDFTHGNGRIEATEVDISTKLGGRIVAVYVNEGDFIKTGQVLAQMQTDVLKAQRDEAKAQHQHAINSVKSIAAQVAMRKSELATTKSLVKQRESELDAAQKRLARSQTLAKEGAVSIQMLDDDQATVNSREAAVSAAQSQVNSARSAIDAAKAQLVSAQSTTEATAATIARVDAEIADSQLKSPRDGRVQYRIAHPGEVLGGGGKVLDIIDLSDVYMTFFLPETVVGKVSLGSEVRIILDASPQYVIPAKISFISSTAQFTPKTVETASERQKLMFRVKANIDPDFLQQNLKQIKTGLPGVAWIKINPQAEWPKKLAIQATTK